MPTSPGARGGNDIAHHVPDSARHDLREGQGASDKGLLQRPPGEQGETGHHRRTGELRHRIGTGRDLQDGASDGGASDGLGRVREEVADALQRVPAPFLQAVQAEAEIAARIRQGQRVVLHVGVGVEGLEVADVLHERIGGAWMMVGIRSARQNTRARSGP